MDPIYHPLIERGEDAVRERLPAAAAQLKLSETDTMIRVFVESNAALQFERIYRMIFGSQVVLLEQLRDAGGAGTMELVDPIYDAAANAYPDPYSRYSREQWLNFLVGNELIEIADDTVSLTAPGQAFMPYITTRGYSNRPAW